MNLRRVKSNSISGFTLFEILVVLAIVTGLFAIAAGQLRRPTESVKSVSRDLSVLVKEVRHTARMQGVTYRLALQMGKDSKYWVERASAPVPLSELLRKTDDESRSLSEKPPPALFEKADKPLKKEVKLPSRLQFISFESVLSPKQDSGPTSSNSPSGEANVRYLHFSPEGQVEEAALQIGDGKNLIWTLLFNPATGQAGIVEKATTLEEAKQF